MNFAYNHKRCTLLRHLTLFTIISVVHCYVMNFVYNHKRCTLLRHEICLIMIARGAKTTPTSCVYKSWYAYSIVTSWTSKRAVVNEWGFIVFAKNLWKLIPSVINFRDFFVQIANSSFYWGDLNNNNNIGFPVFGGYKEILGLDVTILDSSSTRPILSYLVQYFLVSSSRISNII